MTLISDTNPNLNYRVSNQKNETQNSKRPENKNRTDFLDLISNEDAPGKNEQAGDFLGNGENHQFNLGAPNANGAQRFDETGVLGNSSEVKYTSATIKTDATSMVASYASVDIETRDPSRSGVSEAININPSDKVISGPDVLARSAKIGRVTNTQMNITSFDSSLNLAGQRAVTSRADSTAPKGTQATNRDAVLTARLSALVNATNPSQSTPVQILIHVVGDGLKVTVKMTNSDIENKQKLKKEIAATLMEYGHSVTDIEFQNSANNETKTAEGRI